MEVRTIHEDLDESDYKRWIEAKEERKKVDDEARLLANRIALLKQEEHKALKRIEEAKRKTRDIILARQRFLSQQRERVVQEKEKQLDYTEKSQAFQKIKHRHSSLRHAIKEENIKHKQQEARFVKHKLAEDKHKTMILNQKDQWRSRMIKERRRREKEMAEERKVILFEHKKASAKATIDRRYDNDERSKYEYKYSNPHNSEQDMPRMQDITGRGNIYSNMSYAYNPNEL